jgi:hypothetical protein
VKLLCFVAPALVGALSTVAIADSIELHGFVSGSTEGLGKFIATLDYSLLPSGDGQLVVTIENKCKRRPEPIPPTASPGPGSRRQLLDLQGGRACTIRIARIVSVGQQSPVGVEAACLLTTSHSSWV